MKEDYCSYEVAKLLKEKGFDWECEHVIWEGADDNYENYDKAIPNPTHQMAMKWLRESHNLQIQIIPITSRHKDWTFGIDINFSPLTIDLLCFPTYEEAVEAALKYVLENLI